MASYLPDSRQQPLSQDPNEFCMVDRAIEEIVLDRISIEFKVKKKKQ